MRKNEPERVILVTWVGGSFVGPKAYTFITSSGYDPEKGKRVNDPYLGDTPTFGACMPNIRRRVVAGDHLFYISGSVPGVRQYVVGGFEVTEKIHASMAYLRFPHLRLQQLEDGQIQGNIIVDADGRQHWLDRHSNFAGRIENYIVGTNQIVISDPIEIARARDETLDFLQYLVGKRGAAPINVIGRCSRLDHYQIRELRDWLSSLKVMPRRLAS